MGNKGIAILAVITIHFCSTYINSFWALFLDQLSRFAVPVFVAISGYGLTKSFEKNNNLVNFYLKRVLKLLPWFILASTIIMLFRNIFENAGFDFFNYHTWTNALIRGNADYHLYFVPMIFKLYLIFPLLFYIVRKFPMPTLGVALLWTIFLYWRISAGTEIIGNVNQIWPDQMQYLAPETWIYYFVLGIYLAKFKIINSKIQTILLVGGFLLTFGNAFYLQQSGIDSLVATRFTRLPVLIYSTGLILFLLNWQSSNWPLAILGKYSYQIYLFHTLVSRILFSTILK